MTLVPGVQLAEEMITLNEIGTGRPVKDELVGDFKPKKADLPGDVDIPSYAHRDVDRFAVLHDLWMCELNFLVNKRKV